MYKRQRPRNIHTQLSSQSSALDTIIQTLRLALGNFHIFTILRFENTYILNTICFCTFFRSQNDFGKQDYSGEGVHEELFIKKHAYQTGTGFGNYKFPSYGQRSSSSSSSSGSSSSGSGYGFNHPSQATSYSSSSSWSSNSVNGQPQLAPFDQSGYGHLGHEHSAVPLAPTGQKMCTNKPKTILNASTKCSLVTKSCNVQCLNNYALPDGQTKAKIFCNDGEWTLENLPWTDKLACERE